MALIETLIGIESTLCLVQASGCYSCSGEIMATAVAIDDLVSMKLGELEE